jgi:hypothetical protein
MLDGERNPDSQKKKGNKTYERIFASLPPGDTRHRPLCALAHLAEHEIHHHKTDQREGDQSDDDQWSHGGSSNSAVFGLLTGNVIKLLSLFVITLVP